MRSSTCSPTRGTHRTPALSQEFQSHLDEVMRGAQKYRRPASAHSRLAQPAYTHAMPTQAGSHTAGGQLMHDAYAPSASRPPSLTSLASHPRQLVPGSYTSAPQSHISHGTAHHRQLPPKPIHDALELIESETTVSYHQQLSKLYYDVQRGQSLLQQEQQESERLRRTVRERDDAVHNARAHARQAARQLVLLPCQRTSRQMSTAPLPVPTLQIHR